MRGNGDPGRRRSGAKVAVMALGGLAVMQLSAFSSIITVTVTGTAKDGITKIEVRGGDDKAKAELKDKLIGIKANETKFDPNTGKSTTTQKEIRIGKTGDDGSFSSGEFDPPAKGNSVDVEIGGETFRGIVGGNGKAQRYASDQQVEASKKAAVRFNGLPFDESIFGTLLVGADPQDPGTFGPGVQGQFMLVNSSTESPFEFTELKVYRDLDPTFLSPLNFDSSEAIATGVLALDLIDLVGATTVGPAGGPGSSVLSLPVGLIDPARYSLVVGTARAVLGDGVYGDEIGFAIASSPVPEPALMALAASGLAAWLGGRARSRRRAAKAAERAEAV